MKIVDAAVMPHGTRQFAARVVLLDEGERVYGEGTRDAPKEALHAALSAAIATLANPLHSGLNVRYEVAF